MCAKYPCHLNKVNFLISLLFFFCYSFFFSQMNRLNTKTFRIPKTLEIEVQYTLYSKAYQLLVYTIYGNSSVLYFNFNKAARIPAKCEVGHGGGGGEPERKGCGKRDSQGGGKREKREKSGKIAAATGIERYWRWEVYTPLPHPPPPPHQKTWSVLLYFLAEVVVRGLFILNDL